MNPAVKLSAFAARLTACAVLLFGLSATSPPHTPSSPAPDPPEFTQSRDGAALTAAQPERPIPAVALASPFINADRATLDRLAAVLRNFDAARNAGPEAVLAFHAQADPDVRAVLAESVEEARLALAAAAEGSDPDTPADPLAPLRVGVDANCAYSTIQAAVTAAATGATVRVSQGTYTESVDIIGGKVITIDGSYDANCANPVIGGTSNIIGAAGSVIDINASGALLQNLRVSGGVGIGAGVDLYGANARATLANTILSANNGTQGGGMYISYGTVATLTNGSTVQHNTASLYGGGIAAYGRLNGIETYSDISENDASLDGGGIYASSGTVYLYGSDVLGNRALAATGRGGGIYADSAVITLTSGAYIGASAPCCNRAHNGAGIYASASRITTVGANVTIMNNRATGNGGGAYLDGGSVLDAGPDTRVGQQSAPTYGNTATLGAGLFVSNSTVTFAGSLYANTASGHGGGLYAYHSMVVLPGAVFEGNAARDDGGGLYAAAASAVSCDDASFGTAQAGNTAVAGSGGGAFVSGSAWAAENCSFTRNTAAVNGGGLAADAATISIRSIEPMDSTVAATPAAVFYSNTVVMTSASTTAGLGGGIHVNASRLSLDRVVLHGNAATRGGALYLEGSSSAGWVTNTLIYSNTTGAAYGAGIRISGGALTVTHSTIANNVGGAGLSALAGVTRIHVYNNIIYGNSAGGSGTPIVSVCSIDQGGNYGAALNPRFIAPGAGENYALRPDSPAIDACAGAGVTADLVARTRPVGPLFDMGAYEMAFKRNYLPRVVRQADAQW